jgi:RNA polymerase primary sigma factor
VQKAIRNKSFDNYIKEVGLFNPISPAEEIDLTRRVRNGESPALEKLVTANLRFVISVAKQYRGYGLPLEDLIGEGNLGLIKAAQRFDETRGFKFISYAVWWIRQTILQALAEQTRVVRLPMNRVGSINKVSKTVEKLSNLYERAPSVQEIADNMELTVYEVNEILKTSAQHLSIDEPFKQEKDSLLSVLEDHQEISPDDLVMKESLIEDINNALLTLKPREAEIIRMSFGLVGERPQTLNEIGEYFKLTRERVRQIKEKALRRMRHKTRSKQLRKYLG